MAKSAGSDAKSSSRRCFTLVRVTTPMAPRAPLPTKFAVAEKHMAHFLRSPVFFVEKIHATLRNAKGFLAVVEFIGNFVADNCKEGRNYLLIIKGLSSRSQSQ